MPPFVLRWLLLLGLRFCTIVALIYTLVVTILLFINDTQSISKGITSDTTVVCQFPPAAYSDPLDTTVGALPSSMQPVLYPDSDVPRTHIAAPFFTLLYHLLNIFLLALLVVAELPLPSSLQKRVIQPLLIRTMPQLSHKWTSITVLGSLMMLLGSGMGSRVVQREQVAAAWLLLLVGFINVVVVSRLTRTCLRCG